jgi:16S rRNA (guanine527-N7)-methyltransferase
MNKIELLKEINSWDLFKNEAKVMGVVLTDEAIGRFSLYLEELKAWNKKINLFRRKDDLEIVVKDFLDSLTLCRHLPSRTSLLDIGSGGGFPGIPIKISRGDLRVVLSEIRAKKFFFLKNMVRVLSLENLAIMEPGAEKTEKFDFIVSRAFGSIFKLMETGSPYLKGKGMIISMRGRKGEEELNSELPNLKKKGWVPCFVEHLTLPVLEHGRVLIGLRRDVSRETSPSIL